MSELPQLPHLQTASPPEFQRFVIPEKPDTWPALIERYAQFPLLSVTADRQIRRRLLQPKDLFPPEEKQLVFGPAIAHLSEQFEAAGIPMPEGLLADRLIIADNEDYRMIAMMVLHENPQESVGFRLPLRLCAVNAEKVEASAREYRVSFADALCTVGMHELTHTCTYQETWAQVIGDSLDIGNPHSFRRDGLISEHKPTYISGDALKSPKDLIRDPGVKRKGLNTLQEGFIQHLTMQCLSPQQQQFMDAFDPYADPRVCVAEFEKQIGRGSFMRAAFTRDGFLELTRNTENAYGKGSFARIIEIMGHWDPDNPSLVEDLRTEGFLS